MLNITTKEQWFDGYQKYKEHIEHDVSRNVSVGNYIHAPSATELFMAAYDILGQPGTLRWDSEKSDLDNVAHAAQMLKRRN